MDSRIFTIARYTVLEALRTRLPVLVLLALLALLGASFFVESITVTEGARFRTGFYAASVRIACALMLCIHVLASVAREFDDKGLDVVLALDLPRSHYILGKLTGNLAIAALVAAGAGLPLLALATPAAALQWMLSLWMELAIVAAFALFCVVTFSQITLAACLVAAFYLLARSITAIRLMSAHPVAGAETLPQQAMHLMTETLALVLPALDTWTQTAWLVNPQAPQVLLELAGQSVLYVVLLAAAAMFDFYRKNF